jgi:hypothetical protein
MFEILERVYVLTLKGKDTTELKKYLSTFFGDRLTMYETEGTQKKTNGGRIQTSLWKIMRHDEIDDTSLDITKNHVSMIRDAYGRGMNMVLFLEDDARFDNIPSTEKQQRVSEWLQKHQRDWDIFYLGYCLWPLFLSVFATRDVVRIYTPLTTHGYILNRQGMEKVLTFFDHGGERCLDHIDKIYQQMPHFRKYALFPMMCFQSSDPALYTKACDHLGVSIGFSRVCRWVEFLAVLVPFFVIVMVLIWILKK